MSRSNDDGRRTQSPGMVAPFPDLVREPVNRLASLAFLWTLLAYVALVWLLVLHFAFGWPR